MKNTIALVTGGFTGESAISFKSAEVIERNIDREKFEVYTIIITRERWYYVDENALLHNVDKNDFSLTIQDKVIRFDAVFIGLHGSPGEDGKLQGYFDMLGIPYNTCDAATSAITMNKGYTKAVVDGVKDLYAARSVQLFSHTPVSPEDLLKQLNLPLFIKPNSGGSSIGMSKVKLASELPEALERAFKEDSQVLVEEFIAGREFTVGVYKGKEGIQVLPCTEIISSKEFFDFEAKYTKGMTEEITPGRMSEEEVKRVGVVAAETYSKLNCNGIVRIDYILEEGTDKFFFIEVNTVPGQTETSLIPQQVIASGRTIQDFYTELIEMSLESVKKLVV
ncbi:D-alanine--D-alanine ligase [Arcticibacter svalbardensis MN12-7]|uniref:D-alanine--D-alanine ligase n=1 Tax=Arcticibacter svalbardensis MN12-7 TaxID=1150600 RepID=R9GX87_9SPHI|nr:D-alanine--D-alanine ligase [Arcticibacter svalbardensis]EOR96376.1 D-alanine--D-alanine ligase [Arcticibacter svalbardensis MN12-7]